MQLRRGELARAEADARMVLDVAGLAVPVMYRLFTTSVLVDALIERGELEAAEGTVDAVATELAGASLPAAAARAARGRLRAAQRRPEEAVADLTEAGRLLEAMLVPTPAFVPWRADAARALVMLGQPDAAQRLAREEVGLARQFRAPRADTELRATGARPRRAVLSGTESLTASERRVAELAASGMSNRDIAQSLFVT